MGGYIEIVKDLYRNYCGYNEIKKTRYTESGHIPTCGLYRFDKVLSTNY